LGISNVDPVLAIYSKALPQVYGYLLPRCGSVAVAEDLTAETFMAAVTAFGDERGEPGPPRRGEGRKGTASERPASRPGEPAGSRPGERPGSRPGEPPDRRPHELTVAWLVGVARHKLVDHWRRVAREQRGLAAVHQASVDPWDEVLDANAAYAALSRLSPPQRLALTLRYLDGLPVADVAAHLGRSVHATETLLVRARAALRRVYEEEGAA
jgi:RNA polymerase sigma-70 factor (ECF subfamily)